MRTDKEKLTKIFFDRFSRILQEREWGPDTELELRQKWSKYVSDLGCLIVGTPYGLLPFRSSHFVHIIDPATCGVSINGADNDHHIQIPKHIAMKILSIGIP